MVSTGSLLTAVAVLGCACGATEADKPAHPTSPAATPTPGPAIAAGVQHILSLRGSNTIGVALAPKLVEAFLARKHATNVVVHDERAKDRVWISANLDGPLWIEISAPGTKFGFESLAKGYCDVVMASRPVTPDEAKELEATGDLTAPASENVIAMDGIAVIVHPNTTLDRITMAEVEKIFAGEITNWVQLGGQPGPITVFSRDNRSGTHDAFASLVMHGRAIRAKQVFDDSEKLVATVTATEGAIGFVGLPYIKQAKALAIKDGDAEPTLPTAFTVATEDYALSRRLFLYTPTSPRDPLTRELVEFALSDEGQALVGEAGFVPLSLRSESASPHANAPASYSKLASGAARLSVNFRFRLGSAGVDTKALRDLDRLARYLASPVNRGRHLALAGFADAQGNEVANRTLAKQRAEAVAALLKERGVVPDTVESFGSALPIASNERPEGRARNRRVEVWLR